MARGHIQSDRYVIAGPQLCPFDGSDDKFNRFPVRFEPRAVTAFVTDEIAFVAGVVQELAQPPINTNDPFELRLVIRRATGNDQHVLNVESAASVLAA